MGNLWRLNPIFITESSRQFTQIVTDIWGSQDYFPVRSKKTIQAALNIIPVHPNRTAV